MIAHDQLLPSLYHLQREGLVGELAVCAQTGRTVQALAENHTIADAFPGHSFRPFPDFQTVSDLTRRYPEQYLDCLKAQPPGNLVVVALPDQLHYDCILAALAAQQHVVAVKPLVLTVAQAQQIETEARKRGLFVGVEYHKRFDDRVLLARMAYRAGKYGNFRLAQAAMTEPYYYRQSNFQNWCTCENSDMFTYVGCHYVDQIAFITGHLPVEVSVYGIKDRYPNGAEGYLWTDARIIWDNGGSLSVMDAMGYPNAGAGGNFQGMRMLTQGGDDAGLLFHDDQYRGVKSCVVVDESGPNATRYSEPSPDYFRLLYRGGQGLVPVGYGYRSVEGLVRAAMRVCRAGGLAERQKKLAEIDREGIIATPANSSYNERVIEAGRLSIQHGGRPVVIDYNATPGVYLR